MCWDRRDDRTVKRAARLQRAANKRGLYFCADSLALCAEYVWYAQLRGDPLARRGERVMVHPSMQIVRNAIRRGGLVTLDNPTQATGTDDDIPF
jgi:hypothetical protein